MRALIISDIHGNLEALQALPADFDQLWVLGDLVNYGPNPVEVIEFVRSRAAMAVRGNHDHAAGFDEDPRCSARFRRMAEETGRFTRSVLTQDHRQYLRSLPLKLTVTIDELQVLMCHAVPADPLFQYRLEDSPQWQSEDVGRDVNVELVGHTHLPFQRSFDGRLVVNPGSVGQPKHGRAEACFAIWEDGKISLAAVPYDIEQTVAKLRRLSLSPDVFADLSFVLKNGRVPPKPPEHSHS